MTRLMAIAGLVTVTGGVVALAQSDSDRGSNPGDAEKPSPASEIRTVGCESLIAQEIAPAGENDVVAGPVILRGARLYGRKSRAMFRPRAGRDAAAKIGIVAQPGTRFVLSIHKRRRGQASLAYTEEARNAQRVADGERVLRFEACFEDTPSGWPGAFVMTGPGCVRINLALDGRSRPVRRKLEFGRRTC
jgi:hypothetical protein